MRDRRVTNRVKGDTRVMAATTRTAGMITYNRRPRSLWGNVSSVLLQPVSFFRTFPETRQWLWVAMLILIVTGFSAVRQPTPADAQSPDLSQVQVPPDFSAVPGGSISIGGGGGVIVGDGSGAALPPDFVPPGDNSAPAAAAPDVSETVMTALLAAGGVLLVWFIQAFLLCEVSLINGKRPSFGRNLQIAIWAAVPLALMLVVQQLYYGLGGHAGKQGLSLLLDHWAGYQTLPAFSQSVLMTLASNFTLFWLWSLILLYLGGRHVLNGRRAAVLLIVVIWMIVSAVLPALTSPAIPEPASATSEITVPGDFSGDLSGELQQISPESLTPQATPEEVQRGLKG